MNHQKRAQCKRDYTTAPYREWADEDENNGEWPYPTQYVERAVSGSLAHAIRARFGADSTTPVTITSEEVSGGWSEYTQENDYNMTIQCGDHRKVFSDVWANNNLQSLLDWLDEVPR